MEKIMRKLVDFFARNLRCLNTATTTEKKELLKT